jgi:hypothetical protein
VEDARGAAAGGGQGAAPRERAEVFVFAIAAPSELLVDAVAASAPSQRRKGGSIGSRLLGHLDWGARRRPETPGLAGMATDDGAAPAWECAGESLLAEVSDELLSRAEGAPRLREQFRGGDLPCEIVLTGHGAGALVAAYIARALLTSFPAELGERLKCVTFGMPLMGFTSPEDRAAALLRFAPARETIPTFAEEYPAPHAHHVVRAEDLLARLPLCSRPTRAALTRVLAESLAAGDHLASGAGAAPGRRRGPPGSPARATGAAETVKPPAARGTDRAVAGVARALREFAAARGERAGEDAAGARARRAAALAAARARAEDDLAGAGLAPFWAWGVYWVLADAPTGVGPGGVQLRRARFPYMRTPAVGNSGEGGAGAGAAREGARWRLREPKGSKGSVVQGAALLDALRRGGAGAGVGAGGAGWLQEGGVERYVCAAHAALGVRYAGGALPPGDAPEPRACTPRADAAWGTLVYDEGRTRLQARPRPAAARCSRAERSGSGGR